MASDGDLWDDSVLVDALNDALSKYKVAHGSTHNVRENKEEEEEEEEEEGSRDEFVSNDSVIATDQQVSNTSFNANNNGNNKSSEDPSGRIDGNSTSNGGTQNQKGQGSRTTDMLHEEEFKGYSDESIIQYTLLKQYNDLKDQQEKVVKQMYQTFYQGNQMLSHQHPMTNASTKIHPSFLSHNQFSYQSQLPHPNPTYPEDSGFCPLAFNTASLPTSHVNQEARGDGKENTAEKFETPEFQNNTNETDLSVVIGAWYSAGFYTGRYLAQQSLKKGHMAASVVEVRSRA